MVKKAKAANSKLVLDYILEHQGCSIPQVIKALKANRRSIWSMVSMLKKQGKLSNPRRSEWFVVPEQRRFLKEYSKLSESKSVKVAKLVIEIDISLDF